MWRYNNKFLASIDDCPEDSFGFVYKISFSDGTYYIGSKQMYSVGKKRISKKRAEEIYIGKGRKQTKEAYKKVSDFLAYQSSSKIVTDRLSTGEEAVFEVLNFFTNKKDMLLNEAYLILKSYLEHPNGLLNKWVSLKQSI